MKKITIFLCTVLVLCLTPFALHGQSLELTFDNDLIFNSDDAYTGGVSLVYIGDRLDVIDDGAYKYYTAMMNTLFSTLTFRDFNTKKVNASVGISQIHITPENISQNAPNYNDVPYVGIATADFSLFTRESDILEHYRISTGVIGKKAGTKKLQEGIHHVIGSKEPKGWHNQIGEKVTVGLGYLLGVRAHESNLGDGHTLEWFYSLYGDVGNAYIGGGAGTTLRYGKNVPRNFNLMSGIYNPTTFTMVGIEERTRSFGYALDVGASLNWIGEYYLYKEAKAQGYDFYSPRTLLMTKLGMSLYVDDFTVAVTLFPVFAKKNITEKTSWGRIAFGWHF